MQYFKLFLSLFSLSWKKTFFFLFRTSGAFILMGVGCVSIIRYYLNKFCRRLPIPDIKRLIKTNMCFGNVQARFPYRQLPISISSSPCKVSGDPPCGKLNSPWYLCVKGALFIFSYKRCRETVALFLLMSSRHCWAAHSEDSMLSLERKSIKSRRIN